MRWLAVAVALVSCAHVKTVVPGNLQAGTLQRLYCVDAACTIYRSEQPNAADFAVLASLYHIRSVIKLNSAIEGRDRLPVWVEPLEHPMLPAGPVDHDDIADALADIMAAPKPVLLHCSHGVDRTGLVVALYRVKVEHVLPFAAWGEWHAYGHGGAFPMLDDAFFRETGWRP